MIRRLCLIWDSCILLHTFFCVIFHTSSNSKITEAKWLIPGTVPVFCAKPSLMNTADVAVSALLVASHHRLRLCLGFL